MVLCDQLEQQQVDHQTTHQTLVETLLNGLVESAKSQAKSEVNDQQSTADYFNQLIAEHFDTLFTTEQSIDQLKQTILQLAVMGKLVPQDTNDEPASVLLEKIAEEKTRLIKAGEIKKQKALPAIGEDEKPYKLPGKWQWSRIGTSSLSTDYGLSEKTFDNPIGIPVLKMGDIKNGEVILGGQKTIPGEVEGLPELFLKEGDLLYNRTNSAELVGKTGVFIGSENIYTFASYLIRIRLSQHFIIPKYLNICMNSPTFRTTQINPHLKQQCGQANVNGTIMKNMRVPIPPYNEQHRIVTKVNHLLTLCDSLKANLNQAQTTQTYLADAIVKQAVN
jgi:type I restriction enzyme S subunit